MGAGVQGQGRPPAAAELQPQGWEGTTWEATGTATGVPVWEQRFVVLSHAGTLNTRRSPIAAHPSMSSFSLRYCHETSKMRVLRFIAQVRQSLCSGCISIPGASGPGLLTPLSSEGPAGSRATTTAQAVGEWTG